MPPDHAGLRVLIVEDESMVTMLIEDFLADMGCAVAGIASRLDDALSSVSALDFDVAILDVNLNGLQSYPVAQVLQEKGIPFVMATGYGAAGLPQAFRNIPTLGKPFQQWQLERALRAAVRSRDDSPTASE